MFIHVETLRLLIKKCGTLALCLGFVRILYIRLEICILLEDAENPNLSKKLLSFGAKLVQMERNYLRSMWPIPISLNLGIIAVLVVAVCLFANMKSGTRE